jgi:hypothetical protein
MQYVTQKFENTQQGIHQKDIYSEQLAAQGYRITSEQVEAGSYKGGQACCLFLICAPFVFLTGKKPGTIVVTYSKDS